MLKGKVWKYGDDINSDVIFPGKYTYTVSGEKEVASHALEDLDPNFASSVKKGEIVVAGKNFGCGSSREQAAFCLKYCGIGAVVAKSFARLFYRNAINAGLPMIECPAAVEKIKADEVIELDIKAGKLNCTAGQFNFAPLSTFVLGIIEAGGIIEYVKNS